MSGQLVQRLVYRVKRIWCKLAVMPGLRAARVELGSKVQIQGRPIVSLAEESRIQIGAGCVLCSDSRVTALGVNHSMPIRLEQAGTPRHNLTTPRPMQTKECANTQIGPTSTNLC